MSSKGRSPASVFVAWMMRSLPLHFPLSSWCSVISFNNVCTIQKKLLYYTVDMISIVKKVGKLNRERQRDDLCLLSLLMQAWFHNSSLHNLMASVIIYIIHTYHCSGLLSF